jgi:hypothetical protein
VFFWVVTPCGLVGTYQRSEKQTVSIFRAKNGDYVSPKRWYTNPNGVTTQKNIIIFTSVRTSNLTGCEED